MLIAWQYKERVELGEMVRLLHIDLKVIDSKHGNDNTSAQGVKATYIWSSPDPTMAGALCTGPSIL